MPCSLQASGHIAMARNEFCAAWFPAFCRLPGLYHGYITGWLLAIRNVLLSSPPPAGFQAYITGDWPAARKILEECKTFRRNRWGSLLLARMVQVDSMNDHKVSGGSSEEWEVIACPV